MSVRSCLFHMRTAAADRGGKGCYRVQGPEAKAEAMDRIKRLRGTVYIAFGGEGARCCCMWGRDKESHTGIGPQELNLGDEIDEDAGRPADMVRNCHRWRISPWPFQHNVGPLKMRCPRP